MQNDHITDLLPEYLEGFLREDQNLKVKRHLKTCASCAKELEEYNILLNTFNSEMEEKPADTLRERFHKLVDREKEDANNFLPTKSAQAHSRNNWLPQLIKIAAGLALLISGYFFGSYHNALKTDREIAMLKEKNLGMRQTAILSLMENRSASKRIQGVNYVEAFSAPDENILKALTERMLNDENANVRLTAVNALAGFTDSKTAREALIQALKTEKNPNIQIMVIHTLVKIQDKNAVAPMRQLLDHKDTQAFVKEQIRLLIPSII